MVIYLNWAIWFLHSWIFFENKCELFLKETWYQEEAIKNFKLNYIKRNIKELDYYNKDIYSEEESNYFEKSEDKREEEYINKKSDDDAK